jgi:hypothetical protein
MMRSHACHPRRRSPVAWSIAASALVLLASAEAGATIYKCQGEQGIVVYQEAPCVIGRELRNFDTDPPDLSIVPAAAKPGAAAATAPTPAAATRPAKDPRTLRSDVAVGKTGGDGSARKFIRTGMTEGEVLGRIGRPDATAGGAKSSPARWSYLPAADDPDTVTTITFSGGVVSDVSRKVIRK